MFISGSSFATTTSGFVDGVDVSTHASRHLPNSGIDALTTAAPLTNLTSATINSVGTANSLARSDHTHAIDISGVNGIATLNSSQSLTNKTLTATSNNITAKGLLPIIK